MRLPQFSQKRMVLSLRFRRDCRRQYTITTISIASAAAKMLKLNISI